MKNKEDKKKGKEAEVKRPSPERARPATVDAVPFVLGPRLTPEIMPDNFYTKKNASSAKSVGEFRFGQLPKSMI